ncbi:MAG TPA: GNAT family N-acetyltransferase [bacterium]|jgi:RimJ/RimL family protein N-acetyltransferase
MKDETIPSATTPHPPGAGESGGGKFLLETHRLTLRELTFDDTDSLLSILSDPVAMRWYPQTYSREETRGWIERTRASYEKHGHGFWACILKESGGFAGICGILQQTVEDAEEKEVGYLFVRRLWNQGLATEAARACFEYGFNILHFPRIISMIRPENLPSQRVAQKNGLVLEREVFWKGFVHGVWARME